MCRKKQQDECVRHIQGAEGGYSGSSDDEYCYSLQPGSHKTPRSNVIINSKPVKVLVDSGASVIVLDEMTYTKIVKEKLAKALPIWRKETVEC
jgi:hypothetical protein